MAEIKTYYHTRKGKLKGKIIRQGTEFVEFEFTEDQTIKRAGGTLQVEKGDRVGLRKEFLSEVKE